MADTKTAYKPPKQKYYITNQFILPYSILFYKRKMGGSGETRPELFFSRILVLLPPPPRRNGRENAKNKLLLYNFSRNFSEYLQNDTKISRPPGFP